MSTAQISEMQVDKIQADRMRAKLEEEKPARQNKGPWSQAEDQHLLNLVASHGAHSWVKISTMLRVRTAKQCRERYHQNLKRTLSRNPISPEEGEIIERLVAEIGKKWAEIARQLPGRSDNSVKNWWNGGMNRRRRMVVRRELQQSGNNATSHRGSTFDESVESPSYIRPASLAGPHIMVPASHRRFDPPLTSPANSEVSMADSMGDAPSLTSDGSSHFSMSSPHVYSHSHSHHHQHRPPYLPRPVGMSVSQWGPHPVIRSQSYPDVAPVNTFSDRSPPFWSKSETPNAAYEAPLTRQPLHQLADVATRHPRDDSHLQRSLPPSNEISSDRIPSLSTVISNAHAHSGRPALPPLRLITSGSGRNSQTELSAHDHHGTMALAAPLFTASHSLTSQVRPVAAPTHNLPHQASNSPTSSSTTVLRASRSAAPISRAAADAEVSQPGTKSMDVHAVMN